MRTTAPCRKRTKMFTGIVTDIGEIAALTPAAKAQLRRLQGSVSLRPANDRRWRVDRCTGVCMTVVEPARRTAAPGLRSMPRRRRSGVTTVGPWQAGHAAQSRTRPEGRRRTRRPYRRRPRRRRRRLIAREDLTDMARLDAARAARAGAFHRHQGLGRARRRVADRQRGSTADTFSVLIIPHTLSVTTLGARRRRQSISKST